MDLWNLVLERISQQIDTQSFNTWFRPTSLISSNDTTLYVQVPNKLFEDWLKEKYLEQINQAIQEIRKTPMEVLFLSKGIISKLTPAKENIDIAKDRYEKDTSNLNPKYTFETFVVGSCNQFANAASRAVGESPSKAYNPLFIYGGVGLGKTHLMHAVGNFVKQHKSYLKVLYISSEKFMNDLINSIRYDKIFEFREKYRNIDLLLIDDIQFIAGKERTQEEFFHTFNSLYDTHKQIVISSDSPPKDIPFLEERLHSRFEWGLLADLQSPDLETKVAILKKKSEYETVKIPDDVLMFIADNIKSNIRELEGCLIRIVAYSSLTGEEIHLDLAKEILRDIIPDQKKQITIEVIQKFVSDYYKLRVKQLKSKSNTKRIAFPRQIAMYLCKQLTKSSLPEIGEKFGGKHHSTVIHSIRKILTLMDKDKEFNNLIHSFTDSLQ
jgi:chromosomal replication initiator protein